MADRYEVELNLQNPYLCIEFPAPIPPRTPLSLCPGNTSSCLPDTLGPVLQTYFDRSLPECSCPLPSFSALTMPWAPPTAAQNPPTLIRLSLLDRELLESKLRAYSLPYPGTQRSAWALGALNA